jgi:peptide/nickel transport system permease protein
MAARTDYPGTTARSRGVEWASEVGAVLREIVRDPMGAVGLVIVATFVAGAVLAPWIAPHGLFEVLRDSDGRILRLAEPSSAAWLGTTRLGMDVFSQLLYGSRAAILVGTLSALGIVVVGTTVGLIAGYKGGMIEQVLMRATDVAFGIPFLPFALLIVSLAKASLLLIVAVIVALMWRTSARVIRAQVLSLRERPFVWAAKAAGASEFKIIFYHIGPNVLPLSFLYMAFGVTSGVLLEAALSFLGFGDSESLSWGTMLKQAFDAGAMRSAWWWVLPPGLCLALFVTSVFLVSRAYEKVINPRLREL